MYFQAVLELEPIGYHKKIVIGDELSAKSIAAFENHCHTKAFLPTSPESVRAVVGDGHLKVTIKC